MKIIIAFLLGVLMSCSIPVEGKTVRDTDNWVRNRVFLLHSAKGACTGVQVYAPSGQIYMLSAAHCVNMLQGDRIQAQDENGLDRWAYFITIDRKHDLLLLSNVTNKALEVATVEFKHEKIYTMTHGHSAPSYRTDGEILKLETIRLFMGPILSPGDLIKCVKTPYFSVDEGFLGPMCVQILDTITSTAKVQPGSSGGPALDMNNRLVGIVSNFDKEADFSGLVPLPAIWELLKAR